MILMRDYSPWRCPFLIFCGVILGGISMYGVHKMALSTIEQQHAQKQTETLQHVDKIALQNTQLNDIREELRETKAELAFYRKLVSTQAYHTGDELHVRSVSITPSTQAHQYIFRITLTQIAKDAKISKGKLELALSGTDRGKAKRLTVTDLKINAAQLSFKFKHFQRVEGILHLPTDFTPQKIWVTLPSHGQRKAIESNFDWKAVQQLQIKE
jgi:hypothetical protein